MTRYEVVPERSLIEIEASSTLHAIHGRATRAAGAIEIEPDGTIAAGQLEVEVRDLGWGNPLLDRETRRRIDERAHPSIVGKVVGDDRVDERRHRTRGTIEFHDVSREVEGELLIEVTAPDAIVVTGEQRFDVRAWGLQPPRLLALRVSPDLVVRIRIEARRSEA
jgi:hypothetical protein